MTLTLLPALFSIAIFQGIILGLIILKSPIFKSKANNYLAYAVVGLSFSVLNLALELTGDYQQSVLLRIIDVLNSGALLPVLILLFIVNQVEHPFRHSSWRWWLFVPHALSVFLSTLNILVDFETLFFLAQGFFDTIEALVFILILFFIPGVLLYAYTFIKYSNDPKEKKWLTQLWFWVFAIMASWVAAIFIAVFSYIDFNSTMIIIALGATLLIHWITYAGIFRLRLSKDQEIIRTWIRKGGVATEVVATTVAVPLPTNDEKRAPPLTKDNVYFQQLESLCINEHLYLDPTLDRAQVANQLGISVSYVSQIINTLTGDNFSTYINRYRVAAVKKMIDNPEFSNYSLLAMGLEAGFSSKTTFHTAFKKLTSMTPNQWRKSSQ